MIFLRNIRRAAGAILILSSSAAASPFKLVPVESLPIAPHFPGIRTPLPPFPIERPGWPALPLYVTPKVEPALPQIEPVPSPGIAPVSEPVVIRLTRPLPVHATPGAEKTTSHAAQTLEDLRRSFPSERGREKFSPKALEAAFDGIETDGIDGDPSPVDIRPGDTPVEGRPLPWACPASHPSTLPEWDLEREIGLRR
jgi:hypothetical protein